VSDPAVDPPFSYRLTKGGGVRVSRGGRTVAVVSGERARKLAARLRSADADGIQQLLARATGNYRRGNE
jgi:hypothetical protein